jgi:streptogramin lyase
MGGGPGYQSDVVELDGSMWVASPDADTIEQIDPDTNAVVNRIHLPYAPQSLLAANGSPPRHFRIAQRSPEPRRSHRTVGLFPQVDRWGGQDLNLRPTDYESAALTN